MPTLLAHEAPALLIYASNEKDALLTVASDEYRDNHKKLAKCVSCGL